MNKPMKWLTVILAVSGVIWIMSSQFLRDEETQKDDSPDGKYVMAYLYNGKPDGSYVDYIEKVDQATGTLHEVSPFYFSLDEEGSLNQDIVSEEFVDEMHARNIKVVPFLSDGWDTEKARAALENREELTDEIASEVEEYELDGVNMDIEYVTEKDRSSYTELVKLLRSKLPEEKIVTVAVPANPEGWTSGWHGAYDYAELAKYTDYLMLMTYDEHFQDHEKSGPVASLSFVEKSIEYALSQEVSPEKLVLGIPFYGRLWNEDGSIRGIHVPLNMVNEIVESYNGEITYDEEQQSARAVFSIPADEEPITVEWTALTPGRYTLWFENEQSIKAKLALIEKYNLKGAGNWSLGLEEAQTWDFYKEALNKEEN
ncbi:glycosyl hydrolase family 18 protein [Domibacillus indicus]|uniref:glycosyl hydrolase family 18 protein n=1 Tax=Domibacillus indicus TaxID=1437523 RepID=UPI000699129E|nr:glycosyl hydrolase family 18 protein [Domibacillus indicus]